MGGNTHSSCHWKVASSLDQEKPASWTPGGGRGGCGKDFSINKKKPITREHTTQAAVFNAPGMLHDSSHEEDHTALERQYPEQAQENIQLRAKQIMHPVRRIFVVGGPVPSPDFKVSYPRGTASTYKTNKYNRKKVTYKNRHNREYNISQKK